MLAKIIPHFYLRTDKVDKYGTMPVYIRFPRIDGEEPKFSMGKLRFNPEEWNYQCNLPKDNFWRTELEKELLRINRAICRCYEDGVAITKSTLKEIVMGKRGEKKESARDSNPDTTLFVKYYVECIDKKLKNGQIRQSTYRNHLTTINALNDFNPRLRIKDITSKTLYRFVEYLRNRNLVKGRKGNGTLINRLSQIKCIIGYINALGIEIENPFKTNDIYIATPNRRNVYLNDEEFYKMSLLLWQKRKKRINDKEYIVLMMFLFSCATGMRFSDVRSLIWRNLNFENKNVVIDFLCVKNGKKNYIPLNPMAEYVICRTAALGWDKLDEKESIFIRPYSNTTVNKTLKVLAAKAGIAKDITFHAARHTFATYCRDNGVAKDLRKIAMGHSGDITDSYEHWNAYEASKYKDAFACLNFDVLRQNYLNAVN